MCHSGSVALSCKVSQVFIFFHFRAFWNLVIKAKEKYNKSAVLPMHRRCDYPSARGTQHITAHPRTRPNTRSPFPISRVQAHWGELNGISKGLKMSRCLPTFLESQGSSWWLRHRQNKNPCFRGSLKRWSTSRTVQAHPGTPLLPPPLLPSEGANRCFPDLRLACLREGAVLALPFPTYPSGRRLGALTWFTSPPERSLQNPTGGKASRCVWERRRGKYLHWALHFSLQRAVGSTILRYSTSPSFPDWQQHAHRRTRHKMKAQDPSSYYKAEHTQNRESIPWKTATAWPIFSSSDAGKEICVQSL